MPGVEVAGIRRGRCEFPNCRCPCIRTGGSPGMCSWCHHVDAWHANLDRQSPVESFGLAGLAQAAAATAAPELTSSPPPAAPRRGRGTSRAPATEETETLIANILSEEMKTDRTLCCICLTNHCNTVVRPCGHARFCNDCVAALPRPKKCPLCRRSIQRKSNFVPI